MGSETSEKKTKTNGGLKTFGPIADLERHLPTEWWKGLFNSLYLKTDGDVVENDANTTIDIDTLINETGVSLNEDILDVCCGQGRHSLELARRGFSSVQGVDRSRYLIRLARKRAKNEKLAVLFSEGDARKIRLPENSKDCIFLMGNSFGYFEKEEDDRKVLECLYRILRPGGKLALDVVNGKWMSENFEPRSWEWIDAHHFVNRERSLAQDGKRIISREVVTNAEIGVIADQFYAERLYTFEELSSLLKTVGFKDIELAASRVSSSTRGQDLGMMGNQMFITCRMGEKVAATRKQKVQKEITVIMGDSKLPDSVKKGGKFNDEDIDTINRLKGALKSLDHFDFNYLDNHATLVKQLIQNPPELVFNLCDEGYRNDAKFELHIPAILEMLDIPYTGAAPGCLALCYDKAKIRAIAASMDIPTPLETYFQPGDQATNLPSSFPALLKPSCGDSSIGITQNAVVNNAKELMKYMEYLKETFPTSPVLVQEFLSGNEYSVTLLGNGHNIEALPILQVDYSSLPKDLPKILSYESKWLPDSAYWKEIRYFEADISDDLRNDLVNYSKQLFERTECRDYARFDFRCDSEGIPKLLEVNPNPGWCWDGKMNFMAEYMGMSYPALLEKIIGAAIERTGT